MPDKTLLERLNEQRQRAVKQMREIAERENPNAEDDTAYERASNDVSRLGKLMEDEKRNIKEDAEAREAIDASVRAAGMREPGKEKEAEKRKGWLEDLREALKEQRVGQSGSTETLPEIRRFLLEKRAALNVTTATQGPETVDQTLVHSLFERLFDDSVVLQAGPTILRTDTGEALKFPRLTALGALSQSNARRVEGTGQGAPAGSVVQFGEPTFDQVTFNAYKYMQGSMASREVIEDSVLDIRGLLGSVQGRNMANYLGSDLILGTGSSMPRGLVQIVTDNAGQVVTGRTGVTGKLGNSGGTLSEFDQLMDVIYKVKPGYRRNGKFLVSDATVLNLRKIRLGLPTELNHYAWTPGDATRVDTLLGYPVFVDPFIPAQALNAYSILFGDMSQFYVRLVNGVRVEWSTEYAWTNDMVAVKSVLRADADAIDDLAFSAFKGGAS